MDKIEAITEVCYKCWLVKRWQAIRDCRRAHLFDGYDNPGKMPWELMGFVLIVLCIPCTFVFLAARADRTQLLFSPLFHSWHLIHWCTHSSVPSYAQFLENQVLTLVNKHSTWTFPFKALWYLFQNCKYWIKILSTLKSKNTWITESNNSSVSRNKIQSSWPTAHSVQETKKLVIMKYHVSAISL